MSMENIFANIRERLQNVEILEVTTVVGPMSLIPKKGSDGKADGTFLVGPAGDLKDQKVAYTRIDLIDSDQINYFDPEFATGSLQTLRDFHLQRVREAQGMVKTNLEILESLVHKVKDGIFELSKG